jgi:hypothetical protein
VARMPTPGVKERGAIFSGDMSRDPQTSTELARGETSLLLLSPVPDHTRLISRQLITSGISFAFSTRPSVPGPHLQHGNQRNHTIDLNPLPAQATCTRPTARGLLPAPLFSHSPEASSSVLSHSIMTPSLRLTSSYVRRTTTSVKTDNSVHRPCDQGQ